MKLTILAFGVTRDIVGDHTLSFDLDTGEHTVDQLKSQLISTYPELSSLTSLMIAVNSQYATAGVMLKEHDEIALIPPTSGG